MKLIFLIGGGVLAYFLYQQYLLTQKLTSSIKSISVGGDLTNPSVNIILAIQNPTNTGALLQYITGTVNLNGNLIATISETYNNMVIEASGETDITIPVNINDLGVAALILEEVNNPTGNNQFVFTGNIGADFISLPLNVSYTV
jgi:hypothetical protein